MFHGPAHRFRATHHRSDVERIRAVGEGSASRWHFSPRPDGRADRDEAGRRRASVHAALAAAHGTGLAFQIICAPPCEPSIVIESPGPAGSRWMERVLAPAYAPSVWRRSNDRPDTPRADALIGRRRRLPQEAGRPPPDVGDASRTAQAALTAAGPGVRLACTFYPRPVGGALLRLAQLVDPTGSASILPTGRRPFGFGRPSSPGPSLSAVVPALSDPMWDARVELRLPRGMASTDRRRAVGAAEAALRAIDGAGGTFSRPLLPGHAGPGMLLASSEVAALLPPLEGAGDSGGLGPSAGDGLPLGRTASGQVVRSPVEATQGRHLAILGETGMGKSSLLVGVAVRAARHGGLIVLDPLGETAREIRSELAPSGERLVWIAPGSGVRTINALAGIGADGDGDAVRSERSVADLVHALRRVRSGRYTDSSFWGPRLEEMLTRAVRAAAAFPGGTLADALTLLSTTGLTRRAVPPGADDLLRELADRIRVRPDDADGARRLLHEIVRNPTLHRMLCSREPDLRPDELVRPGQILLVSGEAARVGEATARYLLAVYLALVWSQLLAGPGTAKTFVLLDEAQWFAHESLGEMLRLARRRNVHVLLATQSVASLPEAVREAVWTNVADFVAFRGSPEEARELARAAPGVSPDRLLALPRGRAAVLLGKGEAVRWIRTARIPRSGGLSRAHVEPSAEAPPPLARAADDAAIDWLCERTREAPPQTDLRVAVADLRAKYPGDPGVVRRVGARLGRAGAIRRTERTADGPVWWLDPSALAACAPPGPSPAPDRSSPPQPS